MSITSGERKLEPAASVIGEMIPGRKQEAAMIEPNRQQISRLLEGIHDNSDVVFQAILNPEPFRTLVTNTSPDYLAVRDRIVLEVRAIWN
jgi:hypothetical protein